MNLYPNRAALFPKIWRPTDGHGNDLENMARGFGGQVMPPNNFVPESDKTPGYFIGSTLIAKKRVPVYKLPDTKSSIVRVVGIGLQVGTVDSFMVRGKFVYWKLKEGGYVLHLPGYFDDAAAKVSASGKKFNEDMKKASESDILKPVGDLFHSLGSLFGHWKIILVGVAVVLIILVVLKFK